MFPSSDAPATIVAWLFVRGDESVRLEARRFEDGFRLTISGPGTQSRTVDAPDLQTVLVHQGQLERGLVAEGFVLEPVMSDRRKTPRA